MKPSFFFYLAIGLIICSCNNNEKQSISKTNEIDNQENCLDLDSQIYRQTTILWKESWKFENPNHPIPTFYFSKDDLLRLRDKNTNAEGVRLYYIIKNDSITVPSLAFVNMENCEENDNCKDQDCVLMSDLDTQKASFISYETFKTYRDNWIKKADDKEEKLPVYTAVYAYNYSWLKILETALDGESGIWVQYGLRTLGPLDIRLYVEDYEARTTTGNIVYSNIIYEADPNHEGNLRADLETQLSFDFAKPCPRFCPDILQ